jgi:protein-S-isoprenylcysteine O-methyltransferase Ste14
MNKLILFAILSLPVIAISRRSLFNVFSHGFYRFLSWECILWLFICNYKYWFREALSIKQIISWLLLFMGTYFLIAGAAKLKKEGKAGNSRDGQELYKFEKTTQLVDTGIYKWIRHPLYASLVYLTWGIFLKNTTISLFIISLLSTLFLYFTSRMDEKECLSYFGNKYREYMKRTKMFVPLLF